MNLFKVLGRKLNLLTLLSMVCIGAAGATELKFEDLVAAQGTLVTDLGREKVAATGRFGTEYQLIKQAVIEESGAQPGDWVPTFDAIIGRVHSELFPDTVEAVLKHKVGGRWQFSYMGDAIHANIADPVWDRVDAVIWPRWVAYVHGDYEPSIEAHSFCTPAACRSSWAYFGKFAVVHEGEGHRYFGGAPAAQARPTVSELAVARSLRPQPRPAEFLVTRSATDRAILNALEF